MSTGPTIAPIQNEEVYLASSKFGSYDGLLNSVQAFNYSKGYGLSIRDSKKDKYVTLQCGRGGSYRDVLGIGDKRKKRTNTRLINCPFQIEGKKGNDGVWFFKAKNLAHNHEPSSDMSGHPSFRRLTADNVESVKNMTLSGIPPRQILSSLRQQTPNLPASSRAIYNLKAKMRKEILGNQSMISALFEELKKGGFVYDILHDQQGRIASLFIVHPLSAKLAKTFSNIFLMDCTYKTNKYNMPLLDIIGVSCFNTSFYSGFAFLEKEDEESYAWALSAFKKTVGLGNQPFVIMTDRELALMNSIKSVFPFAVNLLCVWHIEKNVLANCKKYFGSNEEFDIFMLSWSNLVYSTTESIFIQNWAEFELTYNEKKDVIDYVKNTWLPWKEKFVSVWTEKYLHFGNRSTARVEGAHAKLKKYLQVSIGGFKEVKDKICLAVEHNLTRLRCNLPVKELKFLTTAIYLFSESLYPMYRSIMTPCTSHFMATMGLPCVHKIKSLQGGILSLDLVHPHWRINTLSLRPEDDSHDEDADSFFKLINDLCLKYKGWPLSKKESATSMISKLVNESEVFFELVIRRPKGRPPKSKKKKGITSTTRDPSRFEHVQSSQT
uniref:PKS-NRPS hybrid synthetase cheA-like n=1 Tax=Erigeron canadensis TaxID=72917 RepID=UPI001CB8940C|nr:PKS-NRPS hybrid synthetase cheA-like [Erigeron canadensis]